MNVRKEFYEYEKFRRDEFAAIYKDILITETIEPNKTIYNYIVNSNSFIMANFASCLLISQGIINKNNFSLRNLFNTFNLNNFVKTFGKFSLVTFINYSIFMRSFKTEYPFKKKNKKENDKEFINFNTTENKFGRIMNSLVDHYYIYLKDILILTVVMFVSFPFNKVIINENDMINESKVIDEVSKSKEDKIKSNNFTIIVNPIPIQNIQNVENNPQLKKGKFL